MFKSWKQSRKRKRIKAELIEWTVEWMHLQTSLDNAASREDMMYFLDEIEFVDAQLERLVAELDSLNGW